MIYVFRSSDCLNFFPDNKNNTFKNYLLERKNFGHSAHASLLEIIAPSLQKSTVVYLSCSVINYSQVGEQRQKLLRAFFLGASENPQTIEFFHPHNIKLENPYVDEIHFSLRDKSGNLIEFDDKQDTVLIIKIT